MIKNQKQLTTQIYNSKSKTHNPNPSPETQNPDASMQAIEPSAHSEPLATVRCLALSTDERHLFAGLASGQVIAVSATTGSTIAILEIGEGAINAISQISLRSNTVPEGGLETLEEEGGVAETEAVACKVLVVAAGEKVMFFKG